MGFSGLKRQHMSARGAKERDALDSDFKSEIEEREKALSRAAPNLKALQQFEAVKVTLPPCILQDRCPPWVAAHQPGRVPTCKISKRQVYRLPSQLKYRVPIHSHTRCCLR